MENIVAEQRIRIENIELELDGKNLIEVPNKQELRKYLGKNHVLRIFLRTVGN